MLWNVRLLTVLAAVVIGIALIPLGGARVESRPTNSVHPAITGTVAVGQTLSVDTGTWANSPTSFAYAWYRCDPQDEIDISCDVVGSTSEYTVANTDIGYGFFAIVTASNADGSNQARSTTTGTVAVVGSPPSNSVAPVMSGLPAEVGSPLSVDTGTWSGSPTSYSYQWYLCTDGCDPIGGATSSTFTPTDDDEDDGLIVAVRAFNGDGGRAPVYASAHATVLPSGSTPSNTAAPSISGTPQSGQTLHTDTGTWTGSPTSYTYEWQRCDTSCSVIAGAAAADYSLADADVGLRIRVGVTATNGNGSREAFSTETAAVQTASTTTTTSSAPSCDPLAGTGSVQGSVSCGGEVTADVPGGSSATAPSLSVPAGTFSDGVKVLLADVSTGATSATAPPAGFSGSGTIVQLSVTRLSDGTPITSFTQPLVLHFPDPQGTLPAYSHDGSSWTSIPRLASPPLPDGQPDGYVVNADGSIDVYTRHATYFGVLELAAPDAPTGLEAAIHGGTLTLDWQSTATALSIDHYIVLLNGVQVASTTDAQVSLHAFAPGVDDAYTVKAIDQAGRTGSASDAVVVKWLPRPAGLPRLIPRWAWTLLAWQEHPSGSRPAAPHPTPSWYGTWKNWRLNPHTLAQ